MVTTKGSISAQCGFCREFKHVEHRCEAQCKESFCSYACYTRHGYNCETAKGPLGKLAQLYSS